MTGRIGLVIVVCGMLGSMLSGIILDKSVVIMALMMIMMIVKIITDQSQCHMNLL